MADIELTTASQAVKTDILSTIGSFRSRNTPRRNMIVSMVGDSNTNGRPGWQGAVDLEWKKPGGIFENATIYNNGANGSQLAGWVNNIATGDQEAEPDEASTANPWAVVNADPDVIILSLGTNDLNSPSNRAALAGSLQSNMDTLVEFYLANTNALILLRMPQPFHWGEGADPFDYLTQWTDDDDCAASSALLRSIYTSWVEKHPRVVVYDSHKHLFGYRCDDKSTDCLDPETNVPMIDDGLHPEDIGYRRITQQIAEMLGQPSYPFGIHALPSVIRQEARWAQNFQVQGVNVGANLIAVELTPELVVADRDTAIPIGANSALYNNSANPVTRQKQAEIALAQKIASPDKFRSLMATAGTLYVYFWETGNTYTFQRPTVNLVTAVTTPYAQIVLNGLSDGPLTTSDVGRCTIYCTDQNSMPYEGSRRLEDVPFSLANGQSSAAFHQLISDTPSIAFPLTKLRVARNGGNAVTYQVRARNQIDGRWVSTDTYNSGKPFADIVFNAGFWIPARIIWRGDLWTSFVVRQANYFSIDVASGTNNANVNGSLCRRMGVFPVITTQPSDQSAADGGNMTVSVTATGVAAYVWQVSTDSGATYTDISGATSSSYTKTGVASGDNGNLYRCLLRYTDPDFATEQQFLSTQAATLTVT